MPKSETSNLPKLHFPTRHAWREWLQENYIQSTGVWLVFYKKHTDTPSVNYDESVEEALCFGWIDSLVNRLDDDRYVQLFTPRKPGSPWSGLNKRRIEKLLAEELMTPAGLAKIAAAKQDGSWEMYDEIEALVIPSDLQKELDSNSDAKAGFDKFSDSTKKALLWWLKSAKREETRKQRIQKLVESAAQGVNPLET